MIILVTVLLESIDLLLLQLPPGRRPTVYTYYKTAYFNHIDISASFKIFRKKLHLLAFVIIKSAVLLRFTNPSKRSTFNVRLVPHKNFRTIAPTVFKVGVSTNWLKKFRLSLIFSSILLRIIPNFVDI